MKSESGWFALSIYQNVLNWALQILKYSLGWSQPKNNISLRLLAQVSVLKSELNWKMKLLLNQS